MIKLSIVIASFNTKKLTLESIGSIYQSKPKVSFEIILVDNNSQDASCEAIKKKFPQVILIENKTNLGFAKANNQGIKRAKGEYLLLLNSDTQVKKGVIDELVEFAEKTPNAGVVAPKLLNENGSIQGSVFRLPTIFRAIKQYWFGEKGLLDKYVPEKEGAVEAAVMAAFLITPGVLKKIGLLDERYFMYFEDLDYCRRLKKEGLKIYYLPTAKVIHFHGGSGGINQMLIESAKKYHGLFGYFLLTFIIWSGQKWQKIREF